MVRVDLQDAVDAGGRLVVLAVVFIDDGEVEQGVDVGGDAFYDLLVVLDGGILVAAEVAGIGELEKCVDVLRVEFDGGAIVLHCAGVVAFGIGEATIECNRH